MSTLRRLYPPMLVVIAMMMILTACAAPAAPAADTAAQAPADEKVTLRMTALGGIVAEAVTALTDNYMEENPNVEIIVDVQGDDMSWQKTAPTTMFAVSDGPDFSWWWCGRFAQFNDMMDAGMLASLDDLYESEGWNEAFPQGTLDYFTHTDGHRYGVNLDAVWTPMVYYNKDIFAEAGVEPPTTWEEFYALGDKIREAGYETLTMPYEMGVRSHLPDGLMLRSWTEQEYQAFLLNWMPDAPDWSLEHKWTDPNGVRIYQYIMDMADSGLLMEGYAGITDYGQSKGLFLSGKAAMFQDGSWSTGATSLPEETTFDWGYFYYPRLDQDNYGEMGSFVANCLIAFEDRDNVEASKDVIAYILQPENMLLWAEKLGGPPGRTDLPAEEVEQVLGPDMAGMLKEIAAAGAPTLYEGVVPPELLASLKASIDLMLTGSLTPEEAAAMQQEETDKVRAELANP